MKNLTLLFCAALVLINVSCAHQDQEKAPAKVEKQTFLYSDRGEEKLYLDRYMISDGDSAKPCIIFMFGGGFVGGEKDKEEYIPYFNYLAEQGFCVASIEYRLGLKAYDLKNVSGPEEALGQFIYTINIAVEDLFDATSYIIGNAGEWNIDPDMIIANGSSAGAVSVLQGEYYISNGHELAQKLPEGFNYAGIIAFAGAVFTVGDIVWTQQPCPIQMFHGDADSNVPYDKVTEFGMGFYGSKYLAASLDSIAAPYYFYTATNFGHQIAVDPMADNRSEIMYFLNKMAIQKSKQQVNVSVNMIGKPEPNKNFTIMDYVQSNFGN